MGFNYLFIFPPCYVALCASKAHHRLGSESVSWCLETSLFLRLPSQDRSPSLSLFLFYILSYLLSKTTGCLSGCLMSSASIQKLFCGIYSAFKCSFDECIGEKVISPSYSSAILGPPPPPFNFDDLRQSPDFPAQVPTLLTNQNQFRSVQCSHSVMSDSL